MGTEILKPAQWPQPSGYSNGIAVSGRQIFVAGQVGWDTHCRFHSTRLSDQVRQALQNICTVLAEAQAGPEHIVRLTWYLTSRDEYHAELESIGVAYRAVMGKNYPVMSVVQVVALMEAQAKVEIEATAVLPFAVAPDTAASDLLDEIEVADIGAPYTR
jgi:enamine deaminase RidA (YjgF/YER057c/UK114 family)